VNVGLAPTTPQTPGHDPVPQASDNESTGGLMETIDETPLNACNVKHWMLFSDATHGDEGDTGPSQALKSSEEATLQLKDDEKVRSKDNIKMHDSLALRLKKLKRLKRLRLMKDHNC